MNLDFRKTADIKKAQVYLDKLITDQSGAILTKINKKRTSSQNRYLHALFTLFGGEWGWTTNEAKTVVKRALGYIYEYQGETFLMQTRFMDTKELTIFIDRFRNYSSANGFYLPSSTEFQENFTDIMNEVERAEIMEKRYGY